YSGPFIRKRLMGLRGYAANPQFTDTVSWTQDQSGNMLVERQLGAKKSDADGPVNDAVCIVVGLVSSNKLFTTPGGNYNAEFNTFSTAKFQLTLLSPDDPDFGPDYPVALDNLASCQRATATGNDHRYLILESGPGNRSLRLSAPMMESRTSDGLYFTGTLDYDTETWPVPERFEEAFEAVKHTHQILPLMVYDTDGALVAPSLVTSKISGALVEAYFRMRHFVISGKDGKYNSFSGLIEQIVILRPPPPRSPSRYRTQGLSGPVRPDPIPFIPSRSEQKSAADVFLEPTILGKRP
ncbi:hypothetical protein FPV67DRAFT_1367531, partial [Lyophyllum atratum]